MDNIYTNDQLRSANDCIEYCLKLRKEKKNEDTLRHSLSSYLRLMFPNDLNWVDLHITGSEALVKFSRNYEHHKGFVDNLVGATAIEYEANLKKKKLYEIGYNQVQEYCAGLLNMGYPSDNIRGVLSDTIEWYAFSIEILNTTKIRNFSAKDIQLIQIDALDCESDANAPLNLLSFLNKNLGRIGSRKLEAISINTDLGFNSKLAIEFIPKLRNALVEISSNKPEYAELIQTVWNKFVNSIKEENSNDTFDTSFYIDEFYLTTIAKFLCANVITEQALISNEEELKSILNGNFFKLKGFKNVVEYDFFGWLNDLPIHDSIIQLTKKIQLDLRVYDYKSIIEEDLFSNLLNELANKSKKLLLGQMMTPSWLAKDIVKEVISNLKTEPKLLDMCCGSGTFIVETIKLVGEGFTNEDNNTKLNKILACITGFDIDPLAVILAKINWLMITKTYISINQYEEISIPIYNADSLFAVTPVTTDKEDGENYILQLLDKQVSLPKVLVSSKNRFLFDKILDYGYSTIILLDSIPDDLFYQNLLDDILKKDNLTFLEQDYKLILFFLKNYYNTIFELNAKGKNGIWNFLILNSFRPALVENNYNGIVSNPPWLTLSRISDNPYKKFLTKLSQFQNIKPIGSSFLHIELATIFLLNSIQRYLTEEGQVGCILPATILNGDHHAPFRNSSYKSKGINLNISSIWEIDKTVFNNRGIVLIGSNSELETAFPISGLRKNFNTSSSFKLYNSVLNSKNAWTDQKITIEIENSYNGKFIQGADIMPRTLYFHDVINHKKDNTYSEVIAINKNTSNNAYLIKDSKKFPTFRIENCNIENDYIYNVIISNCLLPFYITELPLAILPIEKKDEKWVQLQKQALITKSFGLKRLLTRASDEYGIGSNINILWEQLNTRKKLEIQQLPHDGYIVFVGTGGQHVCAHYLKHTNLDFNRLVIDQTVNYYITDNEDEAVYLVGLLNSSILSDKIKGFQPDGNYGKRHIHSLPYKTIPPYDRNNELHLNVVKTTQILLLELMHLIKSSNTTEFKKIINPNEGNLQQRRKNLKLKLNQLISFNEYSIACQELLR